MTAAVSATQLRSLANVAFAQADHATARALCEASAAKSLANWVTGTRSWSCSAPREAAGEQGDYAAARQLLEECLAMARSGKRAIEGLGLGLGGTLGRHWSALEPMTELRDDSDAGREPARLGACSAMHETRRAQTGEEALPSGGGVTGLAWLGAEASQLDGPRSRCAARLWGGAERLREELGAPLPPANRAALRRQVAAARAALGDDAAFESRGTRDAR